MGDTIFIEHTNRNITCTAKIHPVVMFSVLDHYMRRAEGQGRVIGTLLGSVSESGVVEIKNCFPVPHSEKDGEVAVGKDYNQTMYKLHSKVNRNEMVVGWYATSSFGHPINETSALIHEFYGSICAQPVHLVLDTSLESGSLDSTAFISAPLSVDTQVMEKQFHQIRLLTEVPESEKIAIGAMVEGLHSQGAGGDGVVSISSNMDKLQGAVEQLLGNIQCTAEYVNGVVSGKIPANEKLGRQIANALAAVPLIKPEDFDRMFNDRLQDLLMITYISTLIQTQIKISNVLNRTSSQKS